MNCFPFLQFYQMGYGYLSNDFPRMCFNAAKSYQLGWYSDKVLTVNPLTSVWTVLTLGSIVDYPTSLNPVILKIDNPHSTLDYYMTFNSQTGINSETVEGGDMVMLVEQENEGISYAQSWLLAKLSSGDAYTIQSFDETGNGNLTISVDSISLMTRTAQVQIVYQVPKPNHPPFLVDPVSSMTKTVKIREKAEFNLHATDPDNDPVAFSMFGYNEKYFALRDEMQQGTATVLFKGSTLPGTFQASLNLSDGQASASYPLKVIVLHEPTTPLVKCFLKIKKQCPCRSFRGAKRLASIRKCSIIKSSTLCILPQNQSAKNHYINALFNKLKMLCSKK